MRRTSIPTFADYDRELRGLSDDLHMARHALIELMKPEAREILQSYYQIKTPEDWHRWPDEAAEKIIELCTDVTQRSYQGYLYEERAKCPLCGNGPESFYDGHVGFKLPEGLRRHLTGYGRSRECPVFGAARALGRESYRDLQAQQDPGPKWSALKK